MWRGPAPVSACTCGGFAAASWPLALSNAYCAITLPERQGTNTWRPLASLTIWCASLAGRSMSTGAAAAPVAPTGETAT